MDTISRENNSMLPVGGIIVGVVALLLGGYAAISLSKVNKTVAAHEEKLARFENIELQAGNAAAEAAKANKDVAAVRKETNDAFQTVANYLSEIRGSVTKLEESQKRPAAAVAGKKSSEPVVAGPGEYVVKVGDTSGTKIAASNGVSIADLKAVNPGVDWNSLKVGQKLKLPAK
jgi:LysM repeat protein